MLYIKNGKLIDPVENRIFEAGLLIRDGRIVRVEPQERSIPEDARVIDARGLMVAPGLADAHVHFRDPGFTYKEDIETGAGAAAKGGFTEVVLMANTRPPVDNTETLSYVLDKGKKTGIHVYSCANVTLGMKGETLVDFEALAKAGAVGFTDDGIPLLSGELVREAMEQAKRLKRPVSFHEEDPAVISNNGIHAGRAAAYYGIGGSPREAEINLVKRDVELALLTGADIVIQHISTAQAVELVREAKAKGGHVYAEATPHHFTLTQEAVIQKGTMAKMNPPLREESDRLAIIEGLRDGTIDMIATDHAPHSREEKAGSITQAPSGIIGLETALSLGIRELVQKGYLTFPQLIFRMSTAPRRLYGLGGGRIEEGAAACLTIFDPQRTWRVDGFVSKSSNSPFLGEELPGVVEYTICDGKVVYKRENLY